ERQRLTVGNAGQPLAVGAVDAEDHVVVGVEHAVRHRRDAERADRHRARRRLAHDAAGAREGARTGSPRIRSEARSAIISTQALIWAETKSGMAEASTTRSRSAPRTRSSGSSTAEGPVPIAQVADG